MAKPTRHGDGWRIRPYDENGVRFSEVYRSYEDAAFALARHHARTQEIKRGLRAAAPPTKTFNEVCDYYLVHFSAEKRRYRDDNSIIRNHLRPFFGNFKIQEVANQVDGFRVSRRHLNKKTLHNQLTLLISILRVAHDKGWLLQAPRIKKPQIRLFDKDFHYLRTDGEIRRFLIAAREAEEVAFYLYATALYTGMRAGELAGLRREDIDLPARRITVQRSYDGPTKSGEVRYVPILDPLLPLLREWLLKNPEKIVFPTRRGTLHRDSSRIFQEVFHRTLDRAGLPKVERAGKLRRYIVFHDLRHTFASHWMMKGGDLFKLQKILGHHSPQMTQRYAHLTPDVYVADFGRFGPRAPGIGEPAEVSDLRSYKPVPSPEGESSSPGGENSRLGNHGQRKLNQA